MFCLLDEVVPIYASTPRLHNGLGMNGSQLSIPFSVGGAVLMLVAIYLYPVVQHKIGCHRCDTQQLCAAAACTSTTSSARETTAHCACTGVSKLGCSCLYARVFSSQLALSLTRKTVQQHTLPSQSQRVSAVCQPLLRLQALWFSSMLQRMQQLEIKSVLFPSFLDIAFGAWHRVHADTVHV